MKPTRTFVAAAVVATAAAAVLSPTPAPAAVTLPTGLTSLLADGTPSGRAIVELSHLPSTQDVSALKTLGLTAQPMKKLPLVIVAGPTAAMKAAVTTGLAQDVYPDERIQLLDTPSSNAMSSSAAAATNLRKTFTGKGVTVGVVDSGCDATQPDLTNRVKHNVTLVSAEYANVTPDSSNTLVVPVDKGPYSNTDLGSGHGTHVAGIIAADSSSVTDGSRYGVAPGADLACFAIGQVLFTTAVVTAYDYMLDQPDLLGIDVVNNSWGNSYRQYDPRDPVAVATKAVADQGVTVVFAAGNSGAEDVSASLNPFSQSPWVISVAAGTLDRHRGDFSSNGLVYDNSQATGIDAGGHTTYTGDRIGLVHPDVTAPGVDISSTCDTTGTAGRPVPARREHHRLGHLDGLAAHRGRGGRAQAGPARAHPDPGAPGARGHRDAGQGSDRDRSLSGRSATATPTSTRPSRSYDAATGAPPSPRPARQPTPGRWPPTARRCCAATSGRTTPREPPPAALTPRPTRSRSRPARRSCSSAWPTPRRERSAPTCSATP